SRVPIASSTSALLAQRRLDEARRRDLRVRVLDDSRELVPVEAAVEPDTEPAAVADVRRYEEPLAVGLDQHRLHSLGSGAPDREPPVPVVVRQDHDERALAADEEGGRAVARALARLRQFEAQPAKAGQDRFALVHSADYPRR